VWKNVEAEQSRLEKKLMVEVKDGKSQSSLQLTLENKKLQQTTEGYVKALSKAIDKKGDAVGYAVAINGKVHSADAYANADLFAKLWPKLLEASATEAIAEKEDKKFAAARAEDVTAFLAAPDLGKASEKDVAKGSKERQMETDKTVLFETQAGKAVLRRSYLAK
jgi:co-chaperonin GroES (HSP10)